MGAWIEIIPRRNGKSELLSHPTMGAWIEIWEKLKKALEENVAPHDGCVD